VTITDHPSFSGLVTALAVGAGSEGSNSVTKLVSYLKENAKAKLPTTKQGS
jgi:hypothetical protein